MAAVLTINGGSSSLKVAWFDGDPPARRASASAGRIGLAGGAANHERALDAVLAELAEKNGLSLDGVAGVGHRIVHGGARFHRSTRITPDVLAELRRLAPLDPDHLPAEIALVDALAARAPSLPQIACFDTAFHRTMPPVARLVAIPRRYGIERYGFHGLSYAYLLEELARVAGAEAANGRVILAHLGAGASLAAVKGGRSVDTTMGFTPTSGVVMGTRSGDLDPGVLVHLLRDERMDVRALDEMLNKQSGLLGVSETSSDMRDLLAREAQDPRAAEAIALFCHAARKAVGALATTIGGLDTLVFSGGIGEHAAPVRARIAEGTEHLGVRLDAAKNDAHAAVISDGTGTCTVRVIPTDEESMIARELCKMGGLS